MGPWDNGTTPPPTPPPLQSDYLKQVSVVRYFAHFVLRVDVVCARWKNGIGSNRVMEVYSIVLVPFKSSCKRTFTHTCTHTHNVMYVRMAVKQTECTHPRHNAQNRRVKVRFCVRHYIFSDNSQHCS